jgi:hypothetical protein
VGAVKIEAELLGESVVVTHERLARADRLEQGARAPFVV